MDNAWIHKHAGKGESCLVVSGAAIYQTTAGCLKLSEYGSEAFYARLSRDISHQLDINGIVQHTTAGPFNRDCEIVDKCEVSFKERQLSRMVRVSEEAFFAVDDVVLVGKSHIDRLKAELPNTSRKRIRLCTHSNVNDSLHEMFVLYTKDTHIQPNKHLGKEETFHILEGEADFIFYNDTGDVTKIIPLGTKESGRSFFVRVPEGVYHTVAMTSDYLVIHEATPGPYVREHTVWAPWDMSHLGGQMARAHA